nr:membrane-bound PQQ-dependent dehydrogenase, glucose/quinate/shikimate family [uncultured Devosia sp.]
MSNSNRSIASKVGLILLWLFGGFTGILGVALTAGGALLLSKGGDPYYLVSGLGLLAAAVLLVMRHHAVNWLYGAILAYTTAWSIAEVGFDAWSLLPRLTMFYVMGLWLAAPWTQGMLKTSGARAPSQSAAIVLGVATIAISAGAAYHFLIANVPEDPIYQAGTATFPQSKVAYAGTTGEDWPYFGGDQGGGRYSPLGQITPENVGQLEVAWTAKIGEVPFANATPIKIGETVFMCNNSNQIFANNAQTGEALWWFDASEDDFGGTCRGVAYYEDPTRTSGECATRIITGTATAKLVALDAQTGALCADFGDGGRVDLTKGLGDHEQNIIPGYYRVTSAPVIVDGRIVVGGWVTDNQYWGETSGVIRAYDVVTGDFVWAWDLGNPDVHTEPSEGDTYTVATPNSWAPMSADDELGLVYFPTGNATPDYFGANRRSFDDEFSTSVVAVNADTGELAWSFQTIHHDLWDYDVPAQPTLVDLPGENGSTRPALVQATKQGEIYVLDRLTGEPIFDVTEMPVPQTGAVPEERVSPTQPFSNALPSFRGARLREADMWGITPLDQMLCRIQFREARYDGVFTPPGLGPYIMFPAFFGAINWGSVSIDPEHSVMVVNSLRLAAKSELLTREEADALGAAPTGAYGVNVEGTSVLPQANTPYAANPRPWLSDLGVPCIAPPYGRISAVDLKTGGLLWTERLGTSLNSGPAGIDFPLSIPMGVPTHGGSMITQSGLIFIGSTPDNLFRAIDLRTGKVLWELEMEGGPSSTPITYEVGGRQYVVVMAGGQPAVGSRPGNQLVAFALPSTTVETQD